MSRERLHSLAQFHRNSINSHQSEFACNNYNGLDSMITIQRVLGICVSSGSVHCMSNILIVSEL